MKNQYFGDVNDFLKYGLLRCLLPRGECRLLVAWMLTPNDASRDGGIRSYLESPEHWQGYDSDLYSGLVSLLRGSEKQGVALIERSGLLPNAAYYSELVPDTREERDAWRQGLLKAAAGVDLVFMDPDNGLEISSRPVGHKCSSKHVTWQEVQGLWRAGCSVLLYQHFPRTRRESFAAGLLSELRGRTGAGFAQAFQTSRVLFLLASQERHESLFRESVSLVSRRWKGKITPLSP